MFASRVSQPVLRLAGLWQQFQQAAIAVRRLADVMDVPAEPRSGGRRRRRVRRPRRVRRRRASATGDGRGSSAGSTSTVAAGRMRRDHRPVGLRQEHAGAARSRASPIPTKGRVEVDGRDTRTLAPDELRGVARRRPAGHRAVRRHDRWRTCGSAIRTRRMARLEQACRDAGMHDAIVALPRRLSDDAGRARHRTLRRAAPADRARAGAAARARDAAARRAVLASSTRRPRGRVGGHDRRR